MNAFACSLAVTLAVALGGADAPKGPHRLETVMQDDAQMLARSPTEVRRTARRMASLGVDRVRLTASWSAMAPEPESRRRPRFDATDSRQYRREPLLRLDRAIRESRAAGMDVMVDLAFFAPRWAVKRSSRGSRGRHAWSPSAREFGRFARAVAERYSGRFRDEREGAVPQVRLWTTWNEPNHRTFLRPQWERVRRRWRPASPHIYRRMHEAAYQQLKTVSGENKVLIGGLASFGDRGKGPRRGIAPLRFTRELACVDGRFRPLRRSACRRFRPLRADGFAHHPYSLRTAPGAADPRSDRVQIGELEKLSALLAELHRRGRVERPLPLYLTEYGYETSPPDPKGVPPETHARYLGHATFLAWRRPDVRTFPQFLLEDLGPIPSRLAPAAARWGDYQTGLFHHNGVPKRDVVQGFRLPFYVEAIEDEHGRREVVAFGQVRPGEGQQRVELQRLTPAQKWVTEASLPGIAVKGEEGCGDFPTDGQGYYARRMLFRGVERYRAVWRRSDGGVETSPPVDVGNPRTVVGGSPAHLGAAPTGASGGP